MINVPVFARELLVAGRQPFTYTLRALGAGAVLGVCVLVVARSESGPELGPRMFSALHLVLWLSIWCVVPLLSADCLSRERREGTLPLLFLTSLTPTSLVLAKALVHGLRAFTLLLAAVPVVSIAFILGGVSWQEGLMSFLINFSSMSLALAAGVLASTRAQSWVRAIIAASCLGWFFCLAFVLAQGCFIYLGLSSFGASVPTTNTAQLLELLWRTGLVVVTGAPGWQGGVSPWKSLISLTPGGSTDVLWIFAASTLCSILVVINAIWFAAWSVAGLWRDEPPPAWMVKVRRVLCEPVLLKELLQRGLQWEMNRNPVGWLQHRTWSARLMSWSWLGILVCVYTFLLALHNTRIETFDSYQVWLALLLGGSIAAAAAGSFRRERDTGVLELLLVSPMHEWQLVWGRIRGLWEQFLLSIALFFFLWVVVGPISDVGWRVGYGGARIEWMMFCGMIFLTVPGIGLYFALSRPGFFNALVWTVLVGLVFPYILAHIGYYHTTPAWPWGRSAPYEGWLEAAFLSQLALAGYLHIRLYHKLKWRQFRCLGIAS